MQTHGAGEDGGVQPEPATLVDAPACQGPPGAEPLVVGVAQQHLEKHMPSRVAGVEEVALVGSAALAEDVHAVAVADCYGVCWVVGGAEGGFCVVNC